MQHICANCNLEICKNKSEICTASLIPLDYFDFIYFLYIFNMKINTERNLGQKSTYIYYDFALLLRGYIKEFDK